MSLKSQFVSINLKEQKPEKSRLFCNIDYDIAEKVRDYKHQKASRRDKVIEELFEIAFNVIEKEQGAIKSRPVYVKEVAKKRATDMVNTKKNI